MAYTIDECNQERQRLLAACLDPLTLPALELIPKQGIHRILDIGSGQGNTTRMLASCFPEAEVTGLEYDANLIEYAAYHKGNRDGIQFVQGDARNMSFPDASFDLVFTRYLLLHMPDPLQVVKQFQRLLRPGGYAFSFEPDCCIQFAYPNDPSFEAITKLFCALFPQPDIGRRLLPLYREAGLLPEQGKALMGLDDNSGLYARIYRLTVDAMAAPAVSQGIFTAEEYSALQQRVAAMESEERVIFKLPDMWVIAKAPGGVS
jgi:ubiquinone/menaquinone biosynthesis C-methylase UbiE